LTLFASRHLANLDFVLNNEHVGRDGAGAVMTQALVQRNLTEFFRELLQSAMRTQAVHSSEAAEFYLVRLLEGFARADEAWFDRPLALDYLESFHSPRAHRYDKLKRVADTALFVSGVFVDSLQRKLVGSDYYEALGRTAYGHLSALVSGIGRVAGDPFAELAERFPDFVRVLAEISLRDLFRGDENMLRVYTRWMCTRSERDLRWLIRHGITPHTPKSRGGH
jgi:hypothetical protein